VPDRNRSRRLSGYLSTNRQGLVPSGRTPHLDAAAAALRGLLSGQPVLIVLDDVWHAADVEPFIGLAPPLATGTVRQTEARAPSSPAAGAAARDLDQRLRDAIDRAAQGGPTLPELVDQLDLAGVRVWANLASTGRLSGLSFEVEGATRRRRSRSNSGRRHGGQKLR
jgi:hypothetical protein